jgi:predicted ATPase
MLLTRIACDPLAATAGWPFDMPPVAQIARQGLTFTAPVTFLVGENGSGKSTIIEAIADVCEINSGGGKAGTKYASTTNETALGQALNADLSADGYRLISGPRRRRKGFFFRAETLFNLAQNVSGLPGFWSTDLSSQSHGEGFLTVLETMFADPGMYLLDEPEAALSFTSCLTLTGLLHRIGLDGGQVICATHSPLLTALPDAQVLELDEHGIRSAAWADLDIVDHWRRYLAKPDSYLRHVLSSD